MEGLSLAIFPLSLFARLTNSSLSEYLTSMALLKATTTTKARHSKLTLPLLLKLILHRQMDCFPREFWGCSSQIFAEI